jgi:type III restriction enzyme
MKLKDYQEGVLRDLSSYLRNLSSFRDKYDQIMADGPVEGLEYDFPKLSWDKFKGGPYHFKKTACGKTTSRRLPKGADGRRENAPLACHAIDLINKNFLNRQNGLVLWIVPSTQIYRQTISRLKDRNDPYRQILDISSGGRILIRKSYSLSTGTMWRITSSS